MQVLIFKIYYYFRKLFCRKNNYFIFICCENYKYDSSLFKSINPSTLIDGSYLKNKIIKSVLGDGINVYFLTHDLAEEKDVLSIIKTKSFFDLKTATMIKNMFHQIHPQYMVAIYNLSDKIESKFLNFNKSLSEDQFNEQLNIKQRIQKINYLLTDKKKKIISIQKFIKLIPKNISMNIVNTLGKDVCLSRVKVLKKTDVIDSSISSLDIKLHEVIDGKEDISLLEMILYKTIFSIILTHDKDYFLLTTFTFVDNNIPNTIKYPNFNINDMLTLKNICLGNLDISGCTDHEFDFVSNSQSLISRDNYIKEMVDIVISCL